MGMVLACQVHVYARAHMHTLYRACCMNFQTKCKRYKGLCRDLTSSGQRGGICKIKGKMWFQLIKDNHTKENVGFME